MPLSHENWVNVVNAWNTAEQQVANEWNAKFKFSPRPPAPEEVFQYFSLRLNNLQTVLMVLLQHMVEIHQPATPKLDLEN